MAHRADGLNDIFEHDVKVRDRLITTEGTIFATPVNDFDIANKKYVDNNSGLWEISGTGTQLKTADEINIQDNFLFFDAAKKIGLVGTDGDLGVGLEPGKVLKMNTNKITGVVDPTDNQDAATKKYVDDNAGGTSYWSRAGTVLNTATVGDDLTFTGDIDCGDITIDAKTSYASINGGQFSPPNPSVISYIATNGYCQNVSGATTSMTAVIQLPHGAIVTSVIVYGSDATNPWGFGRVAHGSTASSAMANANINTADSSILNATIDNSAYSYYFTVTLKHIKQVKGAKVTYTINKIT